MPQEVRVEVAPGDLRPEALRAATPAAAALEDLDRREEAPPEILAEPRGAIEVQAIPAGVVAGERLGVRPVVEPRPGRSLRRLEEQGRIRRGSRVAEQLARGSGVGRGSEGRASAFRWDLARGRKDGASGEGLPLAVEGREDRVGATALAANVLRLMRQDPATRLPRDPNVPGRALDDCIAI